MAIVIALGAQACSRDLNSVNSWAVLYNGEGEFVQLAKFDLAVVDPDSFPDIHLLRDNHVITLGYLSAGEAESYRSWWDRIEGEPWIIEENKDWPENYIVDVRSPRWHNLLVDEAVPSILKAGFSGLFLDTVDVAAEIERRDPVKYAGAREAMVSLIRRIKERYPDAWVVVNNGLDIIEEIAPYIDGLAVEELTGRYDPDKGAYEPVPADVRRSKLTAINRGRAVRDFPVFVCDYAGPDDKEAIELSRRIARENGLIPYVTTVGLDRVSRQFGRCGQR